ncbi:hypothetical protein FRACYDRAFT_273649 [Fragilariopsis cylindrus CCMP1102]|uniref:Uncharacterized protein n=1 Tax=Fragilariopsis cylindrus CCMP1102 TaxID=635003 RepID=A0A1E7EIH4_9STRA|nr:hypothetical protein FRACYDRAFT_273649 [Fragilariopsis cylindrus CCMP1102]|eukprot:OEU05692.1 hypothetical protein FRACYDRAFT_273649 [Fragilariopsis cylindrus CCMP1102]
MVFSFAAFRPTMTCFRKALVTIPKLSPTHTRAKIIKICLPHHTTTTTTVVATTVKTTTVPEIEDVAVAEVPEDVVVPVECYDPLFILQCSPDLVTEGYREQTTIKGVSEDVCPFMIVESHEEGNLRLLEIIAHTDDNDDDGVDDDVDVDNSDNNKLQLNKWYNVGHILGVIDDGDDDDEDDDNDNNNNDNNEWLWQAYSYSEEKEIMEYSTDGTYTIIKTKKE